MLEKLMPKSDEFFDDFDAQCAVTVEGARMLEAVETAMAQDADLLSDKERLTLQESIDTLKNAIGNKDYRAIKQAIDELNKSSEEFAARRMDRSLKQALAGKNVANPLAMILSARMLLEWLGERHQDAVASEAAERLERAVVRALEQGRAQTRDLGGAASTTESAAAVIAAL